MTSLDKAALHKNDKIWRILASHIAVLQIIILLINILPVIYKKQILQSHQDFQNQNLVNLQYIIWGSNFC